MLFVRHAGFAGAVALFAALSLLAVAPAAHAQANLTFSGGGGSPLTLNLLAPVSYTITSTEGFGFTPSFLFQGVGNPFGNNGRNVNGTLTFRINGGAAQAITGVNSGFLAFGVNSLYITSASTIFSNVGDTVTLTGGTLTTTTNVAAAAPANGSFTTFIINPNNGFPVSGIGVVAAPEPGSVALLGVGLALFGGVLVRRKK